MPNVNSDTLNKAIAEIKRLRSIKTHDVNINLKEFDVAKQINAELEQTRKSFRSWLGQLLVAVSNLKMQPPEVTVNTPDQVKVAEPSWLNKIVPTSLMAEIKSLREALSTDFKSVKDLLANTKTDYPTDPQNPMAVRLSNGQQFIEEMTKVITTGGGGTSIPKMTSTEDKNVIAVPVVNPDGTNLVPDSTNSTLIDGTNSTVKASVLDYTNANPLAVRLTDTNGDYIAAGAGTQYTEDQPAAANPVGTMAIAVRSDSLSAVTSTDGDNIATRATNKGELYVKHADTVTVDGTVAATQSGTWTVQPGNTPNTEPWLVKVTDGSHNIAILNAGSDNINNNDNQLVTAGLNYAYDGSEWVRSRGSVTDGLLVNLGANNDVVVSATDLDIRNLSAASDSVDAVQSGTWTVQPGNTANTTPWLTKLSDGTNAPAIKAASTAAVANDPALVVAVSPNNSVTVSQATAANLNATVTGTVELGATSLAALENINVTVPGTVDLGTVSLTALETITVEQSTADNLKTKTYGAATTAAPSYVNGTDNPLSLTTAGSLRVDVMSALPAGTNAIGKLSANDGVDVGDVTINNGSGASAINIQDGGNSITVDGAVTVSSAAPSALVSFLTTVTTAGTRVQLGTNTISAGILQAPSTNTGVIYVGGSTVSSTVYGAELQPGQSTGISLDNTNKIYIDSSVNGDKCAFLGS